MSVAKQLGISEELLRLVGRAFDQTLPILRESGEPFNPFVLAEGDAQPQLQRFIAPQTEEAVKFARTAIERMPAAVTRYALAYDGRVTADGAKHDAVIVEAGERGSTFAVTFALRYRVAESGTGHEEVGNATYLGRAESCFPPGARCTVYFHAGASDLDGAARALADHRLTVTRQGDQLLVAGEGSPEFRIVLATGDRVRAEAAQVGEGTPHAAALRECDARFDIAFDDLDEALDEMNTLMEVQGALQDATQGYLFLPWNGNLSEPWRE